MVVHRKILRKKTSEAPVDLGNLVTADIDRIYDSADSLHFLWQTPLFLAVSVWVMSELLGPLPALGALATLLVIIVCVVLANRKFSALKKVAAKKTDARVSRTTELIKNLEIIKSLALERQIAEQVRPN